MDRMTNAKEWITRKETAELMGVTVATVDYRVRTGKITEYRDGLNRLRFNRAEVERLLTPVAQPHPAGPVAVVSSDR
jgi:excisionase family DNA binding protein